MLTAIYGLIVWVVVPGIIAAILLFSFLIPSFIRDKQFKVSAIAGFWAGLLLFVIYAVSQLHTIQEPDLSITSLPDFNLIATVIGAVVGFCLLRILIFLKTTPIIGLITLILSAASSSALFSYLFTASIRGFAMFVAIGTIFGMLLYIVLFPQTINEMVQ